jgi:ankyrin repeat protein
MNNSNFLNDLFLYAIKDNSITICKRLINQIDINYNHKYFGSPLMTSIYYKRFEIFKFLLENGADPNISLNYGITPLYFTIYCNLPEFCEHLLTNYKVNINVQVYKGYTPLHCAVYNNYTSIKELLIKNGADINITDKKGFTPLECSKKKYNPIILKNNKN